MRTRLLAPLLAGGLAGCLAGPYGGYGPGGYGGPYGGPYDGPYGGPQGGAQQVRCESEDGRMRRCAMDTSRGVQIARQLSGAACVRGRSWDYDRYGVWVSNGCRADFVAGYGWGDGDGYGQGRTFRCESDNGRLHECPADTAGGVALVRQLSDSPCTRGQTWGWRPGAVWVDHGCRAEFRSGGGGGYPPPYGGGARTLRCESKDGHPRRCDTGGLRGARLQRQLSGAPCLQGRTWGWDVRGIWVTEGCRAEFAVW